MSGEDELESLIGGAEGGGLYWFGIEESGIFDDPPVGSPGALADLVVRLSANGTSSSSWTEEDGCVLATASL